MEQQFKLFLTHQLFTGNIAGYLREKYFLYILIGESCHPITNDKWSDYYDREI